MCFEKDSLLGFDFFPLSKDSFIIGARIDCLFSYVKKSNKFVDFYIKRIIKKNYFTKKLSTSV